MTPRRTSRSSPPQGSETRPQSTVFQPRRGGRTSNGGVVTLRIKGGSGLSGRTLVLHTVKDNDGQRRHCVLTLVRLVVFSSQSLFCCFCLIKHGKAAGRLSQINWGSSKAATFTSKSRVVNQRRERMVALKWWNTPAR